jgi:predicted transcriptional regulator
MITFGEKLKIYIEQEGLNLIEFSEKAEVEYSTFRNILVNFKRNKGSLQIFLKYCEVLGYHIDFILTNKETGEKISETGMTVGSLIKTALSLNKITTAEIANRAEITTTAVSKRIRQLSENTGTINRMIEFINLIGYDLEIVFVK